MTVFDSAGESAISGIGGFISGLYDVLFYAIIFFTAVIGGIISAVVGLYVIALGLIAVFSWTEGGGFSRPHYVLKTFGKNVLYFHRDIAKVFWSILMAIIEFLPF